MAFDEAKKNYSADYIELRVLRTIANLSRVRRKIGMKSYDFMLGEFQNVCRVNPFFPTCDFIDILKKEAHNMQLNVHKGKVLFRARHFSDDYIEKFMKLIEEVHNSNDISIIPLIEQKRKKIKNEKEMKEKKGFYGYDEEESFVNNNWKSIKSGRCNREYETVLYAAENVTTAISEMKPLIHERLSVAEIEIIEELALVDLSIEYSEGNDDINEDNIKNAAGIFFLISPTDENKDAYIYSQVICAIIKGLGYDGIVYSSCQNKKKKNYAIFNYKKCRAISSSVYTVNDITYSIEKNRGYFVHKD